MTDNSSGVPFSVLFPASFSLTVFTNTVHLAITFFVVLEVISIFAVPFFKAFNVAVYVPASAFNVTTFVSVLFHISVSAVLFADSPKLPAFNVYVFVLVSAL